MAAVRRVTAKAASGTWSAEIAGVVADELLELLGADASAVFRIDGDEIVVVGSAAAEGQRVFLVGARFPMERQMVAARIIETRAPVRHAGYAGDDSDAARRVKALGYDVVIGAPVIVEGELWGVVYAGALGPERLPEGTEDELQIFADLCSVAIATAEQRARLESQSAEQQALMRVARTVLERREEREVLGEIAREAAAMLDLPAAALLRDAPAGGFEFASRWPADPSAGAPPPDDVELAQEVERTRQVVRVGDNDGTALPPSRRVLGRPLGYAAPIVLGDRFWGALLVAGEPGVALPPDPGARLARFAELSGLALANAEARRDLLAQLVQTERFAALVELSDDFIAIADPDGMTAYLNAGGQRLVGLHSQEEARTKTILDYLTPEGREHFLAVSGPTTRRTGAFRGETALQHFETGERIPVAVSAFTIAHPLTGEAVGTAIVQHDLRERKRAEAQLRAHADQLEELAQARRSLLVEALESEDRTRRRIGDALHDEVLQELYAARLDLRADDDDDDALARARVAVETAARQLRAAVSDLHPAVSWTRGLEPRVKALLEQAGDRAGIGHRLECSARTGGRLDDLILGVARELIQNVVKHANATFVVVAIRDAEGGVLLEVSDDGRGMPPERPREALRAGHVGLASARERVEALGGRLDIASAPGDGTKVAVLIPALPDASGD